MDNVVSIFTGKTPCKNMHNDDRTFILAASKDSHLDECPDCRFRYSVYIKICQTHMAEMLKNDFQETQF